MKYYYALTITTGHVRAFTTLEARNTWIAKNPDNRRKLTNKEGVAYRYRRTDPLHKYY